MESMVSGVYSTGHIRDPLSFPFSSLPHPSIASANSVDEGGFSFINPSNYPIPTQGDLSYSGSQDQIPNNTMKIPNQVSSHQILPGHWPTAQSISNGSHDSYKESMQASMHAIPRHTSNSHNQPKPLFHLELDIGGGKMEKITVHQNDDLLELASIFVRDHNLPNSAIPRLHRMLEQNMDLHLQSTDRRTYRQFR